MPDQSEAATEHAIIQEITGPLAKLPEGPVPAVADVDFPVVLRGYDRLAVDAYVRKTSQLVAELQATRSPDSAVRRALERVGEEVSGILQRAHDTAGQITAQSRAEAEDRLERARAEAAQIRSAAEARVRDLDADTDRIWAERHRIVDDARELARQLLALAEEAAERFPAAEEVASDAEVVRASGEPAHMPYDAEIDDTAGLGEESAVLGGEGGAVGEEGRAVGEEGGVFGEDTEESPRRAARADTSPPPIAAEVAADDDPDRNETAILPQVRPIHFEPPRGRPAPPAPDAPATDETP